MKKGESIINNKGLFAGTLLNEPNNDFGVHAGQIISFGFIDDKNFGPICVHAYTKN